MLKIGRVAPKMKWCAVLSSDERTADRMTVADALKRYLAEVTPTKRPSSQEAEHRRATILTKHLGKYSLAALTPEVVAHFRDIRLAGNDRKDEARKPHTARKQHRAA